ncbi:MAG: 5'-nucleotidase C-terminal domain-containing protein [Eubacterium sp.]|nr:5'-nucleotidase C-terminal domain-containing protein [Eubacterium sp.]
MGDEDACKPWTYADVISHTNGIDVFLDGHSHDTEQVVMKNKDGKEVVRSACGTKLDCIGYSIISAEKGITDTNIWSWPSSNSKSSPELLNIRNSMSDKVAACMAKLDEQTKQVVAKSDVELIVNDPTAVDASGNPIRMIRRAETNLGDLCTDAFRSAAGNVDIAIHNGGGIRASIKKGDITYGDILSVFPFGNMLTVIEATGQQILDALEWGSRSVPDELGGFLQVSGLSYTVDSSIKSSCKADADGMFAGVTGTRRVKDVTVGGVPIDPKKTYTVAGIGYMLIKKGDGYSMFAGNKVLQDNVKLDNQLLIDYIKDTLGGVVGSDYADPYGQGRIKIIE